MMTTSGTRNEIDDHVFRRSASKWDVIAAWTILAVTLTAFAFGS